MRIIWVFDAVALKGSEIISVAQLLSQGLEDSPVMLITLNANLSLQITPEVLGHAVVIQQSVIDIEKKDHRMKRHKRLFPRLRLP